MFEEMLGGQQAQPQGVSPPKDQAEYQQRVGLWQQFQDKLANDQAFRFSFLQAATQMMQPIQPGQTALGHVGQAFSTGAKAYGLANQADERSKMQQRELAMKERESAARIGQTEASTAHTQAQTATEQRRPALVDANARTAAAEAQFAEQSLSKKLQELDAKIALAGSHAGYYDAVRAGKDIQNNIDRAYGNDAARAKIERDRAAAYASRAAADHANALAKAANANVEAGKGWKFDKNFDKETGIVTLIGSNPTTAEQRVIRSVPPMQYADAVAQAKATIKAIEKNTSGQLFGESKDRLDAYSRAVGEKVTSAQDAIAKLTKRFTEGGATVTTYRKDGTMVTTKLEDVNATPTGPGEDTTGAGSSSQPAATAQALPAEVAQAVQKNAGMAGTYKASDGTVWRFDGRGGAKQQQQQSGGSAQSAPPSNTQQPMFREKSQMANDPTLQGLDLAIRQAATAGDSAKVQELTQLRQQHIQENYLP